MVHYHVCSERESEWECYDIDCMGATTLRCALCDDDEEPIAALTNDQG
jgi:hypothetical protein